MPEIFIIYYIRSIKQSGEIKMLLQKISSLLLAFLSLFSFFGKEGPADSMNGHDFPLIAAEEKGDEAFTRIMSFNLRCGDVNGVPAFKRRVIAAKQINEVMPDSFGVQEGTEEWMLALDILLPQYARVGVDRDTGKTNGTGEHTCIFYLKSKYKLIDSGNFWLSETPDVPSFGPGADCRRVCTWAVLENRQNGSRYVHINTHFDHVSEEARVLAGGFVNDFIEKNFNGVPVVFTADMNTTENGEAFRRMTQHLGSARLLAEDSVSYGTFHDASPETHSKSEIDFILCSGDIQVKTYRTVTAGIDGRFVSDHFPIYADVVIPD